MVIMIIFSSKNTINFGNLKKGTEKMLLPAGIYLFRNFALSCSEEKRFPGNHFRNRKAVKGKRYKSSQSAD